VPTGTSSPHPSHGSRCSGDSHMATSHILPLLLPIFDNAVRSLLFVAWVRRVLDPLPTGLFISLSSIYALPPFPSCDYLTDPPLPKPSYHHFDQGWGRPFRWGPGGCRRGRGCVVGRLLSTFPFSLVYLFFRFSWVSILFIRAFHPYPLHKLPAHSPSFISVPAVFSPAPAYT
jgi:hypothetical protein